MPPACLTAPWRHDDIELEHEQPLAILRHLVWLGLLARDDYDVLRDALRYRNAIAHGYRAPEPHRGLVDAVVRKVEALLQLEPAAPTR